MAVFTMVKNIKEIYPDAVLCFRIGNFYHCYGKDASIIAYLFDYNIKKTKDGMSTCGFPKQTINKVMSKLEQRKINYITFNTRDEYDIEEKQEYGNLNEYEEMLKRANKYLRIKKRLEEIKEELLQNFDKEKTIEKIREIERVVYES